MEERVEDVGLEEIEGEREGEGEKEGVLDTEEEEEEDAELEEGRGTQGAQRLLASHHVGKGQGKRLFCKLIEGTSARKSGIEVKLLLERSKASKGKDSQLAGMPPENKFPCKNLEMGKKLEKPIKGRILTFLLN